MRMFGCRFEFRPNVKRIGVLDLRFPEAIDLFHEGGGDYHLQTSNETIWTKHVMFREDDYPGGLEMNPESTGSSSSYTSQWSVECSVDDTSIDEDNVDSNSYVAGE